MITAHSLMFFMAATTPLVLFPGPAVAFILAMTLRNGRRVGLAATAGVELGYLVHVAGAVIGVSALLAASAAAFSVVKVAGAAWLLWLAFRALRSKEAGTLADLREKGAGPALRGRSAFRRGLLVGALNPKTAVFFLAFLPQFVDPSAGPVWSQLLIFGLLFILMATIPDTIWALLGGSLGKVLPRLRLRVLDRLSGGVFALLAAATLTAKRAAHSS